MGRGTLESERARCLAGARLRPCPAFHYDAASTGVALSSRWSLFIDESGDFSEAQASVVAGVLVGCDAASLDRGLLRHALGDVWGPGPFPPHATELRYAAARVLYAAWTPGPNVPTLAAGRFHAEMRRPVRALLHALEGTSFAERLEKIRAGAFPTRDDVRLADALLRGHPDHARLSAVRDEQDLAMRDLLARVFRRLGPGRASIVGALADREPPGPPPAKNALREDAYVRALTVVAERVARLAGDVDVELWVLTKDVEVGGLGARVPMQGFLLRDLADEATRRAGGRARLRPATTTLRYRDVPGQGLPLHPMLAVADWVANRLRHVLARPPRGWDLLVHRLVEEGIVPAADLLSRVPALAPNAGALPTLGAAGAPEAAIREAFGGRVPERRGPPESAWAWDQAAAWVDASGRWA